MKVTAAALCLLLIGQGAVLDATAPEPKSTRDPVAGTEWISARSQLWLTGDPALSKKFVVELAPTSPESVHTLQWPLLLDTYYRHTGDVDFVAARVPELRGLFKYFAQFETRSGLLRDASGGLVQWPKGLQSGYDYDFARTRENAVLNAYYYHALRTGAALLEAAGEKNGLLNLKAMRVKQGFADALVDEKTGLVIDAPGSTNTSLLANATALRAGLLDEHDVSSILELIRTEEPVCNSFVTPHIIEASFAGGDPDLGYGLIAEAKKCRSRRNATYLVGEHVFGLSSGVPGWKSANVSPKIPSDLKELSVVLKIPDGKISARFKRGTGIELTVPPDMPVEVDKGAAVVVKNALSHARGELTDAQRAYLSAAGWDERVGDRAAVWVSADDQMLRIVQGGEMVFQAQCATAEKGLGSQMDSFKTPLGWHSVAQKIGGTAPWGQVFRARRATDEIWTPGGNTTEDLVLTRILVLTGEEPGRNQGGNVDSFARNIYIHGTNDEAKIGQPSSHGCVRMLNDDVIEAFKILPERTLVLITAESGS